MSNDNNELKNSNESCEGKRELSMEELEQVTGGVDPKRINTSPLLILDGVYTLNGPGCINPADVESMEILKDASAETIYGARGAN